MPKVSNILYVIIWQIIVLELIQFCLMVFWNILQCPTSLKKEAILYVHLESRSHKKVYWSN